MTVSIDFDGVIHRYRDGWKDGSIYDSPVEGSLESLSALRKVTSVAIFTTRNVLDVACWLESYAVPRTVTYGGVGEWPGYPFWNDREYVLITNLKPSAVAYIDDRGIRFENWEQTLGDLAALYRIEVP